MISAYTVVFLKYFSLKNKWETDVFGQDPKTYSDLSL